MVDTAVCGGEGLQVDFQGNVELCADDGRVKGKGKTPVTLVQNRIKI